jgi:hypothetical protein
VRVRVCVLRMQIEASLPGAERKRTASAVALEPSELLVSPIPLNPSSPTRPLLCYRIHPGVVAAARLHTAGSVEPAFDWLHCMVVRPLGRSCRSRLS